MSADRTLPWSWYADPDVLRQEHEPIFCRTWQYAGHAGRVENLGDRFCAWAGEVPVLVVRDEGGPGEAAGESEQLVARFQELVSSALA